MDNEQLPYNIIFSYYLIFEFIKKLTLFVVTLTCDLKKKLNKFLRQFSFRVVIKFVSLAKLWIRQKNITQYLPLYIENALRYKFAK